MSFIAKQPNGLYCRFSTVADCPSHWNMSETDVIKYFVGKAIDEANWLLDGHTASFEQVKECYAPSNMPEDQFKELLRIMGDTSEH